MNRNRILAHSLRSRTIPVKALTTTYDRTLVVAKNRLELSTLTVPKLRERLTEIGVKAPSKAVKDELLDMLADAITV